MGFGVLGIQVPFCLFAFFPEVGQAVI